MPNMWGVREPSSTMRVITECNRDKSRSSDSTPNHHRATVQSLQSSVQAYVNKVMPAGRENAGSLVRNLQVHARHLMLKKLPIKYITPMSRSSKIGSMLLPNLVGQHIWIDSGCCKSTRKLFGTIAAMTCKLIMNIGTESFGWICA